MRRNLATLARDRRANSADDVQTQDSATTKPQNRAESSISCLSQPGTSFPQVSGDGLDDAPETVTVLGKLQSFSGDDDRFQPNHLEKSILYKYVMGPQTCCNKEQCQIPRQAGYEAWNSEAPPVQASWPPSVGWLVQGGRMYPRAVLILKDKIRLPV